MNGFEALVPLLLLFPGQGLLLALWGTVWSAKNIGSDYRTAWNAAKVFARLFFWGFIPVLGLIFVSGLVTKLYHDNPPANDWWFV